jgi:hypothetical protein
LRVYSIRKRHQQPKLIANAPQNPSLTTILACRVTNLACRVTILACRMKLIRCPFAAPNEVFTSRSEPDYDLSVMILACRVTILACRVTILACRMKLIHCPCGAPKEVCTSRSEPDYDLSVTVSRDDFSVSHETNSAARLLPLREVFTSRSQA